MLTLGLFQVTSQLISTGMPFAMLIHFFHCNRQPVMKVLTHLNDVCFSLDQIAR